MAPAKYFVLNERCNDQKKRTIKLQYHENVLHFSVEHQKRIS